MMANGLYGVLGQYSSIYYNLHVAASITTQGRYCISSSILLFEAFLSNNAPFASLNEIITFIHNVLEESYFKIMSSCGFNYVPAEEDMQIVWDIMVNLKQEDLNRLFYKNNLYSFMDNASMTKAVIYLLQSLDVPYLDPNTVPKEIKTELEEFCSILKEYVYYGYQIIDRLDKVENMIRNVAIIIDTDSSILSLDAWYRYVLDKVYDIPMKIKTELISPIEFFEEDEFGDVELIKAIEFIEPKYDYNFYSDELVEVERLIEPYKIIPQDGLRYSIINIMAYCLSQLINDYMIRYTKSSNSYSENKPCLLIMKNEFLFQRAMITDGKKNYASIQEMQEGNKIPEKNSLDIKGLASMTKSTMNETTRKNLKKILYEDVLKAPKVDQVKVIKELAKCEKMIYNSILAGKKEYYKPAKVKSISNYENPMRIQGIKASIVYNTLRDPGLEAIDLEKRNSIDIIKVDINLKNIGTIKEKYPETYEKTLELLKTKDFDGEIDSIALPMNVDTPQWLMGFIDYTTIITDNISGFPLESLSLYRGNKNNNYTNIIKF